MATDTPTKIDKVDSEVIYRHAFDAAQKFNDRTLQAIGWIGGTLVVLFTAAAGLSAYNLNGEKDRIERSLTTLDDRFVRLSGELKGTRLEVPQIELVSLKDRTPIVSSGVVAEIFHSENEPGKPYKLTLKYVLRNIGKGSTGKIWTKIYFTSKDLFSGSNDTDETGYGTETIIPYTSWTGDYTGTGGDFPGAGFSTNVSSSIKILKDRIPKGRYKVIIKFYYGFPESRVERVETYFELANDWVRP